MPYTISATNNYSNKCFDGRPGARLSGEKNSRNVACGGTELTYKHFKVVSSEGRFVDFYKAKGNDADTFSKRQHNGFKVPIENTGDKKQEVHRFKQKDMDLSIFFGGLPLQQNIVPV